MFDLRGVDDCQRWQWYQKQRNTAYCVEPDTTVCWTNVIQELGKHEKCKLRMWDSVDLEFVVFSTYHKKLPHTQKSHVRAGVEAKTNCER